MIKSSTETKAKPRIDFFIKDKNTLVKITQPNVTEVAIFYAFLLEKLNKSNIIKF